MGAFSGRTEVQKKGPNSTTALFGWTRNGGKTWHGAIDVTSPDYPSDNTPTVVVDDGAGTVVQSRIVNNGIGSGTAEWGNYVTIKTDSGYYDTYAHLATRAVKVGDRVKAGDFVGIMGNTGNAAGGYKHLHFERRRTATGAGIDPSAALGVKNAVGIYGTANGTQVPGDRTQIKLCKPKNKVLSSDYAMENMGAVAGRMEDGQAMAYTSEKALQYTKDTLSPMKDALLEGAQNGDIVIFTDGGIGKSQIKLCEPKGVALSSDYALENMGAVAGRVEGGRLMAYTSYKALAYTPDTLSQVKDKLTKGAPGGHLIIFTE